MVEVIKMPGTVRSVNGIKPDANANVTLPSILEAYPVGSIYLSIKPTNPGTLFGGTWVQIKDRFVHMSISKNKENSMNKIKAQVK